LNSSLKVPVKFAQYLQQRMVELHSFCGWNYVLLSAFLLEPQQVQVDRTGQVPREISPLQTCRHLELCSLQPASPEASEETGHDVRVRFESLTVQSIRLSGKEPLNLLLPLLQNLEFFPPKIPPRLAVSVFSPQDENCITIYYE